MGIFTLVFRRRTHKMAFTAQSKIQKEKGAAPTAFETSVAQYLFDLESNAGDELKANLSNLYITAAKEVDVGDGKKAVIIFVPFPQLGAFKRVHSRIVGELEKKFSGKHVFILAQRRILPKPSKNNRKAAQKRPFSRTLTAVQDGILEDLVYPSEIVDRRIRQRVDVSRIQKVTLDKKAEQEIEHKLGSFASVYKKLTGKDVNFQF